jgi:hypothetical protein
MVAPTVAVLAVVSELEEDSTAVAADAPAARVFGAGGQRHHGKWVAGRLGDLVDGAVVGKAIPGSSGIARLAQMARFASMGRRDEGLVPLLLEQVRQACTRLV